MGKNKLLFIPLFLGLILVIYSWYLSYPLTVNSVDDFIFNHISIFYWIGLPLLLISLFAIGATQRNASHKWIISIGIFITLYSISYFYVMLSGSDSQYFRGFSEYFIETRNLNPLQPNHWYYQWPSFFVLSYIASSVSGLTLASFEFMLYTVIGIIIAISLHFYASRTYKTGGFLTVPAIVISLFYFLNYQCVPFSLALALLFLIFMLETHQKTSSLTITMIILFLSISITHAFVPVFLILYLLIRAILDRSKNYGNLLLLTVIIFFLIQFTLAQYSFAENILRVLSSPSDYAIIVKGTLSSASAPIDIVAQFFSRTATIAFAVMCGVGFLFLLIKRKLKDVDKAIFLTGAIYSGLGIFLSSLGWRAIILAFIPISLGSAWLFESKFRPYSKHIFSVLLIVFLVLFTFIPIHQSFTDSVHFQTIEAHKAENFFVDYYNWENPRLVYAGFRVITYLQAKTIHPYFTHDYQIGKEADAILYTVELGRDLMLENYTMDKAFSEKRLNLVYHNGFSYIALKSQE